MTASRKNALAVACLLGVLGLAGALRVYRIDAQSLWYDEGNSARIAERSLPLIVEGAAGDIHPPLYYLVLHYWRAVFGESEAALRALSAACGVLLVLFAFLIGRALFDRRTGLVAAVLVAVSPFAVYYSQEARMYMPLALAAAVSTWALLTTDVRLPLSGRWLLACCYTAATAAGLYTHYAYPFVMIAQGMCALLWWVAARLPRGLKRRGMLGYAAMTLVAIAVFLPWLPTALGRVTGWAVETPPYALGPAILDAYRWLVAGRTLPLEQAGFLLTAAGVLMLLGLFPVRHEAVQEEPAQQGKGVVVLPTWFAPACMLVMAVVPVGLLFVFNLYRESYLKFLLVSVLPLSVLVARGVVVLSMAWSRAVSGRLPGRLATAGAVALLIGPTAGLVLLNLPSLANLYDNPAYARDDYRGIARMIQAAARPGDAVLFDAPNQWEVFTYYHRPGEVAAAVPLLYRPADEATVDAQMRSMADAYARLFVLYYGERESDPHSRYERWLAEHAFKAEELWVGNIRLAVYGTRPPPFTRNDPVRFGDVVRLERMGVSLENRVVGDVVPIELVWRAGDELDARYKVFVHIGAPDAPPVAQNDSEPAAGFRPTDRWAPGEAVVDRRGVWLKPGTPPGRYGVYVGLYDGITGLRLEVFDAQGKALGDRLWLGDITVGP